MEIIFEVLLQFLIAALQVIAELVLQMIGEALIDISARGAKRIGEWPPIDPRLAALLYAVAGGLAGAASIWFVPHLFIDAPWLRWVNLLVTPLAAGLLMGAFGAWRRRRELDVLHLESFTCAFCFALAMAAVRLALAKG